jgi:signal transduction histidine kinase/CheY-like chemotaxis protein
LPQIGEQVDYLRFLPEHTKTNGFAWWAAILFAGPGWVVTGCAKLAAGSFLTYLAVERGVAWQDAAQPATMYRIALLEVFRNPAIASALMLLFVVTCQIKINTTNAYAGSIAWSNFFSRLTHAHPGRVVWVVFNVLLALLLMEIGIFRVIQSILGLYANFAVGWMGALAADLMINKPLRLSPPGIEFKRAYLFDINPVGVGAMTASVLVSTAMSFNLFGDYARALAPFAGLLVAFAAAPAIAWATGGKYYLARRDMQAGAGTCTICEQIFEGPDMAACPAYGGSICSLCCSLDARCHDLCKPRSRVSQQIESWLPPKLTQMVDRRIGAFLGVLLLITLAIAAVLSLIGFEYGTMAPAFRPVIHATLLAVFLVLFIFAALISWLLVLAHSSRRAAEGETQHQTQMLMEEITAHERTDAALIKAKAVAESANTAKSRYIVGVIHEIRAPLNAIFGYAQLLERGSTLRPADAVRIIRRSTEHLSNLVDGLLDISQIETGSLQLHRDRVNLPEFLDQISDMFRLTATAKGIAFKDERHGPLPEYINTDEKRLRQILINLLSNAVKYTERGSVTFRITLRGQVAEFEIADTGIGIRAEDLDAIFEPFERGHMAAANAVPGTGLGLTISRLLTQILGGELTVQSSIGQGSTFRVRMLLSKAHGQKSLAPERRITGYSGTRRRLLLTDDDEEHLALLAEILSPLGFILRNAKDGNSCLQATGDFLPDLVILDIAMPGISGLETASQLRLISPETKILILSGNFHDVPGAISTTSSAYDAFLAKPTDVRALLQKIQTLLDLNWIYQAKPLPEIAPIDPLTLTRPDILHLRDLLQLGRIGYVRGIEAKLTEIADGAPPTTAFTFYLRDLVRDFALGKYMSFLESLPELQIHD